jgi:CheY-like chemotaxis protein/HPt (histidine-containing phosphotransfer) domain-containing protein
LIAEDNPINQEVALAILGKSGIQAKAVDNGIEAIQAMESEAFDLILMDVQMPEMDGLQATKIIRRSKTSYLNHRVPIIALTANAIQGDHEKYLSAGMDDYLSKPYGPTELLEKIRRWTMPSEDRYPARRVETIPSPPPGPKNGGGSPTQAVPTAPTHIQPAIQFDVLCRRVLDDKDLALDLIHKAAQHLDHDLAEVELAIQKRDLAQVKKLAHKLKGAMGNLAAEPMHQASKALEACAEVEDWNTLPTRLEALKAAGLLFTRAAGELNVVEQK